MDKAKETIVKKPYSPPHLIVHGTVRELTKKVGVIGGPDSGGKRPSIRTKM